MKITILPPDPKTPADYSQMQESYYEGEAAKWSLTNKDPVVSWYHEHGRHEDYDTQLFRGFDTTGMIALDFGCGPGRSMIRYKDRFARIDGVDIAAGNLVAAHVNLKDAGLDLPLLYKNNGRDLQDIGDNTYDVVFSVICLQHICVYDIRFSLMQEFYRVLKPGGYFCAQMGFGSTHLTPYHDNYVDARGTNGANDVGLNNEDDLKGDLEKIGFKNYSSVLRTPCQDQHPYWIWFQVQK